MDNTAKEAGSVINVGEQRFKDDLQFVLNFDKIDEIKDIVSRYHSDKLDKELLRSIPKELIRIAYFFKNEEAEDYIQEHSIDKVQSALAKEKAAVIFDILDENATRSYIQEIQSNSITTPETAFKRIGSLGWESSWSARNGKIDTSVRIFFLDEDEDNVLLDTTLNWEQLSSVVLGLIKSLHTDIDSCAPFAEKNLVRPAALLRTKRVKKNLDFIIKDIEEMKQSLSIYKLSDDIK